MAGSWHDRILLIIPSINGGHLLERMVPTLRFKPANVIVLDQGSSDSTERVCREAGIEMMQLDQPHTYTQASNIGARIARQRGVPFVCIANNDIVFRTDVLGELLAEMDRDPRLGIVAPAQIILDPSSDLDVMARRVFWNLQTVEFMHDLQDLPAVPRIDADFCELTCALIRMEAIKTVGFLDDVFGFYHEDADFCFRLRKAGYGAAYLPRSQIYHYTSSTFGRGKREQFDYMARNRAYFARKHLGYGVRLAEGLGTWPGEANAIARRLDPLLRRFGLVDNTRPLLTVGRVSPGSAGYVLTTQGSHDLPRSWNAQPNRFRTVLSPSDKVVQQFRSGGVSSFGVPLGVDADVFNPWNRSAHAPLRRDDETTYLAIATAFERPLDTLRHAWARFAQGRPVRLIVVGSGLSQRMRRPDAAYRTGNYEISCYEEERLTLFEPSRAPTDDELAALYGSVDFTVVVSAEGSNLTLLESLACGTPVVFDPAGSVAILYDQAIGGTVVPYPVASVSKGGLLAALEHSDRLSVDERRAIGTACRYGVLGHATLRHTAMGLRHALEMTQEQTTDRAKAEPAAGAVSIAAPAPALAESVVAPAPSAPQRLRSRLSAAAGQRFTGAATGAAQFGTVWRDWGLPAAITLLTNRLRRAELTVAPPEPDPEPVAAATPIPRQASPLLIGYIDAQLGIGQSLRGLATALAETGAPFSLYPFGVGVEGRRSISFMPDRHDEVTPHDVNIIEVSPAELPRVFANVSADHFHGSYNILRTYWELARGPALWRQDHGMERIDEIWAPNAFCAGAFGDFFSGPIVIVPPCLEIATPSAALTRLGRKRFGLDQDVFYFMFSFDYHSFHERKNPLAVVRAFMTAFPTDKRPVGLVVKTSGAEGTYPEIKRNMLAAADADGRITIVEGSLSRGDMVSLMAGVDCYVSMHRSEGFGLGMAEALALEKPVIATDYSGSSEFVTDGTAYPIPYRLKSIRSHEYVHTDGQVWAEPDESACVDAMRRVVDAPQEAAERAKAGRAFVEHRYGAATVGRIVTERLETIRRRRLSPPAIAKNEGREPI